MADMIGERMSDKTNGLATADDFRKMQEFEEPERVLLPKLGKEVLLRRPSLIFFLSRGRVPLSLSNKIASAGKDAALTWKEIQDGAKWMFEVLQAVMVQPRCVMENPKADEITADMIDMDDAQFMVAWAQGEHFSTGGKEATSLDRFPGERRPEAGSGHG